MTRTEAWKVMERVKQYVRTQAATRDAATRDAATPWVHCTVPFAAVRLTVDDAVDNIMLLHAAAPLGWRVTLARDDMALIVSDTERATRSPAHTNDEDAPHAQG